VATEFLEHFENIDYIITSYLPDNSPDSWKTKTIEFDLKNTYRYEGAYGFIISIPGLLSDDDIEDSVEVEEIEIKLTGTTLWNKINRILKHE